MKSKITLLLLLASSLLSACHQASVPGQVRKGVFVDALTAGLDYETPTRKGITTQAGEFEYLDGEEITFRIGGLTLGKTTAGPVITPLTLTGSQKASDAKVADMVRLLLSLDEDDNAANGLAIKREDAAKMPTMHFTNITNLATFWQQHDFSNSLVDRDYAQKHFNLSLQGLSGQKPAHRFTTLSETSGQPWQEGNGAAGCVSDQSTGLTWELKSQSGLRAASHRFQPALVRGAVNNNRCDASMTVCTTSDYAEKVNEQRLCNADDWRVPSETELKTLLDFSQQDTAKQLPAIDRKAFPDTTPTFYWSDTMRRVQGFLAVWFDDTHKTLSSTNLDKESFGAVRLVRGNPMPDPLSKEDITPPAYIPLNERIRPATPGENVLCVDVNTRDLVSNLQRVELLLDTSKPAYDQAELTRIIAEKNTATHCGKRNWRVPNATEMSKLLSIAIDPDQTEFKQALPQIDSNATYWVSTATGMRVISASQTEPQQAAQARVVLYSQTDRPAFVRKRPGANIRPANNELASWRERYAQYQHGATTQSAWPEPTLDESVKTGFADIGLLPPVPFPADNPYSAQKVELGQKLFFDTRLSRNNQISCASCHSPQAGWSDSKELSTGHIGQLGSRNAMTILNTAYVSELFWDGRAKSLEDQALGPVINPDEMHQPLAMAVNKIAAAADYAPLFMAAFGDKTVTTDRMAKALATFERTIISKDSAFDRFLKGDRQALSDDALWGMHLFRTKARCINCHNTPLFSDNRFRSNGLHYYNRELEDFGRYLVTGKAEDMSHFRTPTLRDVMFSGNYMHNGLFPISNTTGVLAMYDAGMVQTLPTGLLKYDPLYPKTSPEIQSLGLTQNEKTALFEFMKAISATPRQTPASEDELFRR